MSLFVPILSIWCRRVLLVSSLLVLVAGIFATVPRDATWAAEETPDITIEQAWTRATPGGADNAAVYLTITNTGSVADQLTGAETAAADHAMLHMTETKNGVTGMHEMSSVTVPAARTVAFKPGGMHIMLTGLKAPLLKGDSFFITLTFAKSGRQDTTVKVMSVAATGPEEGGSASDALLHSGATPLPKTQQKQ